MSEPRIVTRHIEARETAWGAFRDGPDYQPTDRYDARGPFDAGWDARARLETEALEAIAALDLSAHDAEQVRAILAQVGSGAVPPQGIDPRESTGEPFAREDGIAGLAALVESLLAQERARTAQAVLADLEKLTRAEIGRKYGLEAATEGTRHD